MNDNPFRTPRIPVEQRAPSSALGGLEQTLWGHFKRAGYPPSAAGKAAWALVWAVSPTMRNHAAGLAAITALTVTELDECLEVAMRARRSPKTGASGLRIEVCEAILAKLRELRGIAASLESAAPVTPEDLASGAQATEEERLEAARAAWRQGFPERVRTVGSVLSLSSTEDEPTPICDEQLETLDPLRFRGRLGPPPQVTPPKIPGYDADGCELPGTEAEIARLRRRLAVLEEKGA